MRLNFKHDFQLEAPSGENRLNPMILKKELGAEMGRKDPGYSIRAIKFKINNHKVSIKELRYNSIISSEMLSKA